MEQVGPYTIDLNDRLDSHRQATDSKDLPRYRAVRQGKDQAEEELLTAKCVSRELISKAAKKKSYQKWNAQAKVAAKVASAHVLTTLEVVKTPQSYWFFQEGHPEKTVPLSTYLSGSPALQVNQMVSLVTQITQTMHELHAGQKFVHGNLDADCVFVVETEAGLVVKIDISEHHQLRKLLRVQAQSEAAETQEETGSEEPCAQVDAFQEFKKTRKVTVQSDIQSLGQLVLLLMKYTELSPAPGRSGQVMADFVKCCSFEYKKWNQVLADAFFALKVQAEIQTMSCSNLRIEQTGENATAQAAQPEFELINAQLQESTIIQEETSVEGINAQAEECKAGETKMLTSAALCEDLEKLLETGFAELIRSQALSESSFIDESYVEMDNDIDEAQESPFPKGKTVFDAEDDDASSKEAELEDGYEVICAQAVTQIPSSSGCQQAAQNKTMLGQGASYVVGRAGRLISSLFR